MAKKAEALPSGFVLVRRALRGRHATSNRKVPAGELGGLDGDPGAPSSKPGDRRSAMSGMPQGRIKSIKRAPRPEPGSITAKHREFCCLLPV